MPLVTPEIRQQALEAALRCSHPGSIPSEVIRVAREFEAYLAPPAQVPLDATTNETVPLS